MFRRRQRLSPPEIEELLREHDVKESEIDELIDQNAINIRKLRVVAKTDICPYSENVRNALITIGELESKSLKLKMTKFIRRSLGGSKISEKKVDEAEEEGDGEEEDLDDYFNDDEMSVFLDASRREGQSIGLAFINKPPKTPGRSFWDDLSCIFCGSGSEVDKEPPTYDPYNSPRNGLRENGNNSNIQVQSKNRPSLREDKAKPKKYGNPELMSRLRLAEINGEENSDIRFDFDDIDTIKPEIVEEMKKETLRISCLYLGILGLSDNSKFEWKMFSDRGNGTEVHTAFPPGYGEGTQVAIRASTYVHANYKRVLDIMLDDTRSHTYDPNVFKFKQLLVEPENRTFIRHYWFHPVWPTQARDIVMLSTWGELDDGSVCISTIGLPNYVELSAGSVRAYVCSSSCLIRPGYSPDKCPIPNETWKKNGEITSSDNGGKKDKDKTSGEINGQEQGQGERDDSWCHVTFCTHVDPGGSVPAFVTNLLGPNNSLKCLNTMKGLVEKEERDGTPFVLNLTQVGQVERSTPAE